MLNPSLLLLERQVAGLHIGGKSALAWYGITHYVSQHSALHLYGWAAARLPDWFLERFPAEYHRKRLFELGGTLKAAGHGPSQLLMDLLPIVIIGCLSALWLAWELERRRGAATHE